MQIQSGEIELVQTDSIRVSIDTDSSIVSLFAVGITSNLDVSFSSLASTSSLITSVELDQTFDNIFSVTR